MLNKIRIINVISESEIDHLSTLWATMRIAQLLSCQKSTAGHTSEWVEAEPEDTTRGHQEVEVDELVTVGGKYMLRTIPD